MEKYKPTRVKYIPSPMGTNDPVELAEKYNARQPINVDQVRYDQAVEYVLRFCNKRYKITEPLTLRYVIDYCLDKSKSPGVILREMCVKISGESSKGDVLTEDLIQEFEKAVEKIDEGEIPTSLFSAWLKDELLPEDRVRMDNKCRLFMASCLFHVVVSHSVSYKFNKQIYNKCWPKTPIAIGMDKFNGFFPLLKRAIGTEKPSVVASIDGKKHDVSCHPEEFEAIAWIRSHFTENSFNRLKYVYRNIIKSYYITADGRVGSVNGGNKSGQGNTTVDNCLIQFLRFVYALAKLGKYKVLEQLLGDFPPLMILGDDILSWSKHLTKSDYSKIGEIIKRDLGAVWKINFSDENHWEFCSHSPTLDSGFKLAAVPVDKIMSSIYKTQRMSTNWERVRGCLIELFPHHAVFEDVYAAAKDYALKHELHLPHKNWYRNFWYGYQCAGGPNKETRIKYLDSEISKNDTLLYPEVHFLLWNKRNGKREMSKQKAKKDGQTIRQLQNRIHQQKQQLAVVERKQQRPARHEAAHSESVDAVQQLVLGIIDPDSVGGLRWPDMYSEGTASFKSINNFFLPVKKTGGLTIANFPDGAFWVEIHPELEDSIRYLEEVDGTTGSWPYCSGSFGTDVVSATNLWGVYKPGTQSRDSPSIYVPSGSFTSRDIVIEVSTNDDGVPQPPTYLDGSEGKGLAGHYYPPCLPTIADPSGANVNSALEITYRVHSAIGVGCTINMYQHSSSGSVINVSTSALHTLAGTYTLNLNLLASPLDLYSQKFSFEITANTGACVVEILRASIAYQPHGVWYAQEALPDLGKLVTDVEKYRVTAQSCLTSYFGSTLTDAGFISSILYRGGIPAQMAGINDYSSVAEHPSSYDGPLKHGSYGYWEGMDSLDYSYRTPQSRQEYKRPYLIMAGLYNGDPTTGMINSPNLLRCRIITQVEFTSSSQMYDVSPSPVCPNALVEAMRVVSGVPNVMENGLHWKKIKQIANKTGKVLKGMGKFAWNHKAEIMAAANAAKPIVQAMMA